MRELTDGEFVTVLLEGVRAGRGAGDPACGRAVRSAGRLRLHSRRRQQGRAAPDPARAVEPTVAAVVSGLALGDKVIVEGLQKVRPGQPVAPGPVSPQLIASMKSPCAMAKRPTNGNAATRDEAGGQSMISAVFVDRPRLAIVIAFVITIAGALALLQIPVAQFPDIVPPQVTVTAVFPGASAEVVESSVAQPLEAQVVGVDKMLYMKSTSGNDGSYTLTVSFALGTDPDINTVNVNNRVQTALAQLPTEVQAQGLTVQKKSSAVLQFIVLYSENGQQDPLFITNYAIINVLDAISRTPGVGQATLFAKLNYSMRIWFDSQRLTSLNLAPSDVIAAIRAQKRAGAGRPHRRPPDQRRAAVPVQRADPGPADHLRRSSATSCCAPTRTARCCGSRTSPASRSARRISTASRGSTAAPAVPMGIYLAPGANAVKTAKAVQATLAKLSERFPPGLTYLVQYDSTTFVTDTITEVLKTLGEAFVLVVIVVFLFLGNLRATIIPAIAVPVSLIGAFAVLLALGYSANTVSLLAMVLAIGIVVDDAIVVVENVERVMEEEPDATPAEATKKAMAQITAPIIAITLVLLSVFVPIAFIPGISGTLFRQFAVTISAAMVISAINALTLSPALCAVFLRHTGPRRGIMGRVLDGIDWVRDGYAGGVRRLLRFAVIVAACWCWYLPAASSVSSLVTPTGLPARRGPGRVLHRRAIARWRVGGAHQRSDQAGRSDPEEDAGRSTTRSRSSAFRCSTAATSRTPRSWWRA